jgi:hypothetical protein
MASSFSCTAWPTRRVWMLPPKKKLVINSCAGKAVRLAHKGARRE